MTEREINEMVYEFMLEGRDDVKRELGHNKSMVVSCEFIGTPNLMGEQCLEIWDYFYDPDYGNCYTFTAKTRNNKNLQARKVDFWQEENELTLTIDLQPEESMEVKRNPGAIVVVHDLNNQPDIHTEGIHLMAGLYYSIAVAKSTVILLPLPFKTNCTDYLSLPWKNIHRYRLTSRTCTVGCSQYHQMKLCQYVTKNISLFYERLPYNIEVRTAERRKCAKEEEDRTIEYCRSICGLPCRDSAYQHGTGASVLTGREKYIIEAMANRDNPNNLTFNQYLVHAKIFYSTLEHKIYRHMPKYDTMELFSYLGGYSGVWLGFSLLTVYELFEIVVCTILFAFRKLIYQRKHKRVTESVTNSRKNARTYKKKKHFR